ncbi:MAG: hypothetical protein AB8B93_20130 [Pseudomonadales bacterium]
MHSFRQANASSRGRLDAELAKDDLQPAVCERLIRKRDALATLQTGVDSLLQGLGLTSAQSCLGAARCNDGLPRSQDLLSYRNNLFRDWSWDNGEAQAMLAAVNAVLAAPTGRNPQLGRTLTLGSGAGRLSYDLHQQHQPVHSVLLDMNPLLSALAAQIIGGVVVHMPEFPVAPRCGADASRIQRCALPSGAPAAPANLQVLVADALAPPFAAASFDTVLTPWLVDILPISLRCFVPVVNRLLPCGGRWVNTGTLAFALDDESENYAPDEVPALIEAAGFELQAFEQVTQPYLQSPLSAHGRVEQIYSWHAVKRADCLPDRTIANRPTWLDAIDAPIPADEQFAYASAHHLLNAQVLGAVNGKRSLQTIARLLAAKHQLDETTARSAIEAILLRRDSGT